MKEILNWVGVGMAVIFLVLLFKNASKVQHTTSYAAKQLIYVQQATAQHTADANQVIDWASKK